MARTCMTLILHDVIQQCVPVLILLLLSICDPQLQYQISAAQSCVLFPEDDLLFYHFQAISSVNEQFIPVSDGPISHHILSKCTFEHIYFLLGDLYNLIQFEVDWRFQGRQVIPCSLITLSNPRTIFK